MPSLKAVGLLTVLCVLLFSNGALAQNTGVGQTVEPVNIDQGRLYSGSIDADASDVLTIPDFPVEIRYLLQHGEFDQLDQLANKARSDRARLPGGAWKLRLVYAVLVGPGARTLAISDEQWDAHLARLKNWVAARPNSITARVALAHAYLNYGWKARGDGYANTVTQEGWRLFRERAELARSILDEAAALPDKCPEWYLAMQDVALAQKWDKQRLNTLFNQAVSFEPGYYYYYLARVHQLLPEWYGRPGEAEQFAWDIARQIGGQQGAFIYFELASKLQCCRATSRLDSASWEEIKQGFGALEQLYGSSMHDRNVLAYFAVRARDQDTAREIFARLGDNWDHGVWQYKAAYERARGAR